MAVKHGCLCSQSQGQRMGGGKPSIDHYVTPIKTGRIIVEFGGAVEYEEVKPFLTQVANQLPFKAKAVSYEIMQKEAAEKRRKEAANINITCVVLKKSIISLCISNMALW